MLLNLKPFAKLVQMIEDRASEGPTVKVNKGVVLSTGGYGFNQEMLRQYAPEYTKKHFFPVGTLGDNGSGIRLAEVHSEISEHTENRRKTSTHE